MSEELKTLAGELGVNNNSRVATSPTSHSVCIQRGVGLRVVGGRVGSFGGPGFAEVDQCCENEDMCPPVREAGAATKLTPQKATGDNVCERCDQFPPSAGIIVGD